MKIKRKGTSEDRENEGDWKEGKKRFGRWQQEGANTPRTVAPMEEDSKLRSPTFKRQVHHGLRERLRRAFDTANTFVDDGSTAFQYD